MTNLITEMLSMLVTMQYCLLVELLNYLCMQFHVEVSSNSWFWKMRFNSIFSCGAAYSAAKVPGMHHH